MSVALKGAGSLSVGVPTAPAGAARAAIAHPEYCRTDTANGTPCGNGDAIRWWKDAVTGT